MNFTVAGCLLTLRDEINEMAPHRCKASDGTIGDAGHQRRKSDHNRDANGVVRALDVTHDPAGGADMSVIAEHLRERRDPRTKYVIFNRRIFSPRTNWAWKQFDGQSHENHLHLSVVADRRADDRSEWASAPPARSSRSERTSPLPPRSSPTSTVRRCCSCSYCWFASD